MKRSLQAGLRLNANPDEAVLAKESAVWLLERSIEFGHGRLAVIRLLMAVRAGADVPAACWDYCHQVAEASKDPSLQANYSFAAQVASRRDLQFATRRKD